MRNNAGGITCKRQRRIRTSAITRRSRFFPAGATEYADTMHQDVRSKVMSRIRSRIRARNCLLDGLFGVRGSGID